MVYQWETRTGEACMGWDAFLFQQLAGQNIPCIVCHILPWGGSSGVTPASLLLSTIRHISSEILLQTKMMHGY